METIDPKLLEGIAFFEQMLQTLPGDRASLEFLSVAYEHSGQSEQQRQVLIALAESLLQKREIDDVQKLQQSLQRFAEDPAVQTILKRIEIAQKMETLRRETSFEADHTTATSDALPSDATEEVPINLKEEIQCALRSEERFLQHIENRALLPVEICQEMRMSLQQTPDLNVVMLISLLDRLEENHADLVDTVLADAIRFFEMPAIPLDLFDLSAAPLQRLPSLYIQLHGVVPFACLADQVMVAVLNPADEKLRDEIQRRIGAPCSFFLCRPLALRETLKKIEALEAASADDAKKA
ncbi:MAG: hypothetical protein RR982_03595 [Kiritimatiellia bacterium]